MRRNEQGYSMLLVLLVVVLVSVLGIGLVTVSSNSLKTSAHEQTDQSIFYIAEAGLNYAEAQINYNIQEEYIKSQISPSTFNTTFYGKVKNIINNENGSKLDKNHFVGTFNGDPEALIEIKHISDDSHAIVYKIQSTGKINTNSRKLEKTFEIPKTLLSSTPKEVTVDNDDGKYDYDNPPEDKFSIKQAAAYISNSVDIKRTFSRNFNAHVYLKTNNIDITPKVNKSVLTGIIYNKGYNDRMNSKITPNSGEVLPNSNFSTILDFPDENTYKNLSSTEIKSSDIKLASNMKITKIEDKIKTININVPSGTHSIYIVRPTSDLLYKMNRLNNVETINVTGNGKVKLYFVNGLKVGILDNFKVNATNSEQVNLYFKEKFDILGRINIKGNVYASNGFDLGGLTGYIDGDLYVKKKLTLNSFNRLSVNSLIAEDDVTVGGRLVAKNTIYLPKNIFTVYSLDLTNIIPSTTSGNVTTQAIVAKDLITYTLAKINVNGFDIDNDKTIIVTEDKFVDPDFIQPGPIIEID